MNSEDLLVALKKAAPSERAAWTLICDMSNIRGFDEFWAGCDMAAKNRLFVIMVDNVKRHEATQDSNPHGPADA